MANATSSDMIGIAKSFLPNISGAGGTIFTVITWIIVIIVLAIIIAVTMYFVIQRRRYNNSLIVFDKINGRWIDVVRDKGMTVKFGNMGIKLMYFKKLKVYEPMPTIQSGNRRFYFKRRADGTLENFEMLDDESPEKKELIEMNQAMLYHHTGINRGLEARYKKEDWKAYIPMAVGIGAIIIICLFVWLIMDKWMSLSSATTEGVKAVAKMTDQQTSILAQINNMMARMGINGSQGYIQGG
jgi:hypothetical protein